MIRALRRVARPPHTFPRRFVISPPELRVALLWHFHQPLYANPASGIASLPWVRLHGLKDYLDMVSIAREVADVRLTINVVPSLVDQILDVASGRTIDPALLLARRAADTLGPEERLTILDLFFSVPYRTRIAPFPRYAALFHKRGDRGPDGTYAEATGRFKPRDWSDLMVWFHLAWCGDTLRRHEIVRELIRKGEGFTEEEKGALLGLQREFMGGILPSWRSASESGAVELSTSPYYHPILPLLCDTESALEAVPGLALPHPPFHRPEDAVAQIRAAVARHEEVFGARPAGVWPSEGSLSEPVIRMLGEEGFAWTASDEGLLAHAFARSSGVDWKGGRVSHHDLCRAWRLDGRGPALFFRDREISDLLGFTYSGWEAERAASDFVRRLLVVRDALGSDARDAVLPVILDGENAWEFYPDNASAFLRALYRQLSSTRGIRTSTLSAYLADSPEPRRLDRLRAGSWIRSDFTTWIGHPEKNRAWDLLRAARDVYDRRAGAIPAPDREKAWRCLQAAEGSDWFWWFGDEHTSEQDPIFDASFRDLLKETYRLLGEPAPDGLAQPLAPRRRRAAFEPPTSALGPVVDGRLTDYFEWLGAGICDCAFGHGSMRPGFAPMERVAFGWGPGHLYARVDPVGSTARQFLESGTLAIVLTRPAERRVSVRCAPGGGAPGGGAPISDTPGVTCAAGRVVEIAVPLASIGARDGDAIAFTIVYESRDAAVERLPRDGEIVLEAAPPETWSV